MKKLITIIAASVISLSAFGQVNHQVKSFLNDKVSSITVSNAAGTIIVPGITNLNSTIANGFAGYGTNYIGTTWTNKDGSYVILTAANLGTATNDLSTFPLFKDVDLWPDRADSYVPLDGTGNGTSNAVSGLTITVRAAGRTGKSGTVLFRFCPLYDGTNESTISGQVFPIGLVINGATPTVLTTNVTASRLIGAKRLRLREISNGDTSSASDAFITDINISGFVP